MGRRANKDLEQDLARLCEALSEPRTMRYLVNRFHVHRSTIHRWLQELINEGVEVMRVGTGRPTRYVISEHDWN